MTNNLNDKNSNIHKPVLVKEVCEAFKLIAPLKYQADSTKKPIIIDATIGGGGHTAEFIKNGAFVLGIDADEKMVKIAGDNLQKVLRVRRPSGSVTCPTGNCDKFFKIVNGNFTSVDLVANSQRIDRVDGILFDLGISSYHFLFNRGFSFQNPDSPLDMRLSDSQKVTASDLLNALPKNNLVDMFSVTMPYFKAAKLAKSVVEFRKNIELKTVSDFLEVVNKAFPESVFNRDKTKISISTLPFLALRIAVNTELDNLRIALEKSWKILKIGGILAVISFHSGEDKIVKEYFRKLQELGTGEIQGKLIVPGSLEMAENPRSRSAKLRIIIKKI